MTESEPREKNGYSVLHFALEEENTPFNHAAVMVQEKGIPLTTKETSSLVFSPELQLLTSTTKGHGIQPEFFKESLLKVTNPLWDETLKNRMEATYFQNRADHLAKLAELTEENLTRIKAEMSATNTSKQFAFETTKKRGLHYRKDAAIAQSASTRLLGGERTLLEAEEIQLLVCDVVEKYFPQDN